MKLDRNVNPDGAQPAGETSRLPNGGKYALVNLRKLPGGQPRTAADLAALILAHPDCVEFGAAGGDGEFFVVKLKDRYAEPALFAYAGAARANDDGEFAADVEEMARRSGARHPLCRRPD